MLKISSPMHLVVTVLATAVLTHAEAQTGTATASSAPTAHAGKMTGSQRRAPLDLHAPPLNHIYPSSQLRYILAADDSNSDSSAEVSVKSSKAAVRVPGAPGNQLQAVPWAIFHPTQAWRIFTPLVEE